MPTKLPLNRLPPRAARRARGIALLLDGRAVGDVAKEVGVARQTASKWATDLRADGHQNVGFDHTAAHDETVRTIRQILDTEPPNGVWSLRAIGRVLRRRHGIDYHVSWLWQLAKEAGYERSVGGLRIHGKPYRVLRELALVGGSAETTDLAARAGLTRQACYMALYRSERQHRLVVRDSKGWRLTAAGRAFCRNNGIGVNDDAKKLA